ncbi:hypothetical protein RclHR1_03100002 [Rhizophagus clarus]|uniref:Uncharacterized protein n=1 Tax=Rhizophagus clarus TaxID=94130 RepID=A0A2Z6R780_9GLOM|nr:hypothetical protein RclHR1_03100002 [Rhizophagus clarus]
MAVQFDNNNLYAKAKLGRILIDNKKESRGLKMLEDTAEKGLDMGQTYLGEFYEKKKQNLKEAVEFYSMAARQKRGYYSHAAYHQLNKLKGKGLINKDVVIKDIFEYHRNECKYETEEKFEKIL